MYWGCKGLYTRGFKVFGGSTHSDSIRSTRPQGTCMSFSPRTLNPKWKHYRSSSSNPPKKNQRCLISGAWRWLGADCGLRRSRNPLSLGLSGFQTRGPGQHVLNFVVQSPLIAPGILASRKVPEPPGCWRMRGSPY